MKLKKVLKVVLILSQMTQYDNEGASTFAF